MRAGQIFWAIGLCLALLLVGCAPAATGEDAPSLLFRGEVLTVGMEADALVARLGTDYTVVESESCAGVGMDRMYTYPSVRLYVFAPKDGTAILQSVTYTDDGVQTAQGLRIGSGCEEVIAALGEASEASEEMLIYRSDGAELVFRLREGIVMGIELR